MWNLNSLAKNLQEQVTKVARDTGIDEHLANAQARLGTFSDELLEVKPQGHRHDSAQESTANSSAVDLQQGEETGGGHNGWDNGFDDAGFGSQQVAFADFSEPTGVSASEEQLREENSLLRRELQRYKLAAVDALGELEEVKEKLEAAEKAGESLQAEAAELRKKQKLLDSQTAAASSRAEAAEREARELSGRLEELESQLASAKEAADLVVKGHLQDASALQEEVGGLRNAPPARPEQLQLPASPSVALSPEGSAGAVTPPPAGGEQLLAEVAAAKAKLQRAKRTLDAMKKREAEAVAAKEAAETRLAAAMQEREQQVASLEAEVEALKEEKEALASRQAVESLQVPSHLDHGTASTTPDLPPETEIKDDSRDTAAFLSPPASKLGALQTSGLAAELGSLKQQAAAQAREGEAIVAALESEVRSLKHLLEAAEQSAYRLQTANEHRDGALADLQAAQEALRKVQSSHEEAVEARAELESRLQAAADAERVTEQQLADKQAEAEALSTQLEGLKKCRAQDSELAAELNQLREIAAAAQAASDKQKARIGDLEAGAEQREAALQAAEAERSELRERLEGEAERCAEADRLRLEVEERQREATAAAEGGLIEAQEALEEARQECSRLGAKLVSAERDRSRALEQAVTIGEQLGSVAGYSAAAIDADAQTPVRYRCSEASPPQQQQQELTVSVAGDEQLQANPLFSPELASEKQPPTPPAGGAESRMAALRLDCEAALAEVEEKQATVEVLQSEVSALREAVAAKEISTAESESQAALLRDQLMVAQQKVEELSSELQLGQRELSEASSVLNEQREAAAALEAQLRETEKQLETAWAANGSAEVEGSLAPKLKAAEEEIASLQEKLQGAAAASDAAATAEEALGALRQEIEAKTDQVEDLTAQIGRLESSLEHAESSAASFSAQQKSSEKQLGEVQAEAERATARVQELEERLTALDEEKARLQGSLETVTAELDSSREARRAAEEAESSTDTQLAALRQQVEAKEAECCALNDKIRVLLRTQEEYQGSKAGLQEMLSQKMEEIDRVKEQLRLREDALQAVREGSKAEANMAAAARKEAEAAAAQARAVAEQLRQDLAAAEERVEAALHEGCRKQDAAQRRCAELEEQLAGSEEQQAHLRKQLTDLQAALAAAKEVAVAEAQSAASQAAREQQEAVAAAIRKEQESAQAQMQELQCAVSAKAAELEERSREAEKLRGELASSLTASSEAQDLRDMIAALQRQLKGLEEERAKLTADLEATKAAAQDASGAAAERQKRFNLLNSQFRKKEAEMLQQLQAAQGESELRKNEAEGARSTAAAAQEELQELQLRLEQAEVTLSAAGAARKSMEERAEAAEEDAAVTRAELVSLRASLEAVETRQASFGAVNSDEFKQRIAAAVADAEAFAQQKLQEAENAVEVAKEEAAVAQKRAHAAEMAKIQLSMQLAEYDDRRGSSAAAASPNGPSEEQFAHSIMARRVATAEEECDQLRRQLQDAEDTIKRLEFQVRMMAEPQQIGGTHSSDERSASQSVLDLFGCGANYRR